MKPFPGAVAGLDWVGLSTAARTVMEVQGVSRRGTDMISVLSLSCLSLPSRSLLSGHRPVLLAAWILPPQNSPLAVG